MGPTNYKQVVARFRALPPEIKRSIEIVPELIERYEWQVSISFVFSQIETVKHDTLYKGLVNDIALTLSLRDSCSTKITGLEAGFGSYSRLYSVSRFRRIQRSYLENAEKIRDRDAHGKILTEAQSRDFLVQAFKFIEEFTDFVYKLAGFRPFGDGRGFKGRGQSLSKETSLWVLKGMGIPKTLASQTKVETART